MSLLSSWFIRLVLSLAVIALLGFDGIQTVVAHVGGKDDANNAAYAAAEAWNGSHDSNQVFVAAKAAIPSHDHLVGCTATTPDAQTWTCTLIRTARTVLFGHLGFMRSMTVARETGSGTYEP